MSQSEYFLAPEEDWEEDSSIGSDEDISKLLVGLQLNSSPGCSDEEVVTVQVTSLIENKLRCNGL